MPPSPRPPDLVRAELIRLDRHLQSADAAGDLEGFAEWARRVLDHPCAPHTWTVGLVADMLGDCLVEQDEVEAAARVHADSAAAGQVAEPFATLRTAELALLSGERGRAEALWEALVGEGPVDAFTALSIGFLVEDVVGDHDAAHAWFTRGVTDLLDAAVAGHPVDLGELDDLLEAREQSRVALDLPPRDELTERAMDAPLSLEDAPAREEYPAHPSTLVPCARCGFRPGEDDAPIPGYRVAAAWDPADGPAPEVDRALRDLRTDVGQTPVLVAAPAAVVQEWAAPYDYAGAEATDLFAAMAPDVGTIPWPPSRNEPCWCGSAIKYKRCCGR